MISLFKFTDANDQSGIFLRHGLSFSSGLHLQCYHYFFILSDRILPGIGAFLSHRQKPDRHGHRQAPNEGIKKDFRRLGSYSIDDHYLKKGS